MLGKLVNGECYTGNVLMLSPTVSEIEEKSDKNEFWRNEWKEVKNNLSNLRAFVEYAFESNKIKKDL